MKTIKEQLNHHYSDNVLRDNEIKMNYSGCTYVVLQGIIMFCFATFYDWSYYNFHIIIVVGAYLITALDFAYVLVCRATEGKPKWLKWFCVGNFAFASIFLSLFTTSGLIALTCIIPVAIASRYYSKNFTLWISVTTITLLNILVIAGAIFGLADIADLNYIQILPGMSVTITGSIYNSFKEIASHVVDRAIYTRRLIFFEVIPSDCLLIIFVIICMTITSRGKRMIEEQAEISSRNARIKHELDTATAIQDNMLEVAFPVKEKYELHAMMHPAKEVGGDFYDFFELDEDHVAIVIGDVSDKGVPSALFMAMGGSIMHSYGELGYSPSRIFKETNRRLCSGNKEGMFITAFLGILDLKTGILTYANAGHCAPLIKKKNGEAQYLNMQADLFLGSIEGIDYADQETKLDKGDEILLYTDGVTEAMNPKEELFGKARLMEFIKNDKNETTEQSLTALLSDIREFANGAEQSDDITMLLLEYKEV